MNQIIFVENKMEQCVSLAYQDSLNKLPNNERKVIIDVEKKLYMDNMERFSKNGRYGNRLDRMIKEFEEDSNKRYKKMVEEENRGAFITIVSFFTGFVLYTGLVIITR